MSEETRPTASHGDPGAPCRQVGKLISKGGCFALHDKEGPDVWLELCPIPLHLLDEEVEIRGLRYGANHIWVEAIGPFRKFS